MVARRLLPGIWLGPLLAIGLMTVSGTAVAAADPEALIRDGIELRRAGDDLSALKRFQQAYELSKSPKAIAQVGLAEQALGRWAAADRHLHQALQSIGDPWIRKYRAAIDQALGVVSQHVGRLDVTGSPAGADVRVDGELMGHLPLPEPIAVTAGGVAIEVRASGHLPIVRATTVTAGLLTRENFNLQPLSPQAEAGGPSATGRPDSLRVQTDTSASIPASAASPPSADAAPPPAAGPGDGGRSHVILTLTFAGLSAASLAFGLFEHLSWQRDVTSFDSMNTCGGSLPDKGSQGCKQLYDKGQREKVLTFVGYGVGAALAATAVALYLTDPGRPSEPQRVACAPNPRTSGIASFGCTLRF